MIHRLFRLMIAALLSLLIVPPVAAGVGILTVLEVPLPGELPEERPNIIAEPSIVYDREGNEIGVFRGFDRTVEIAPRDLPPVLIDAVIAIEDQRFFQHNGVDVVGIARAFRANLTSGSIAQGGSTITQQYIKNAFLSGEQTFERKGREALLALEIEQRMTKDEIMFAYLESAYYGAGAYGIGAAAEVYFNKSVADLDISEAATLAGVLQSPTRLSPRTDIEAADERRRLVLQEMLDMGSITVEEYERHAPRSLWQRGSPMPASGLHTPVAPPLPKGPSAHGHFVDWVETQLLERFGPERLYAGGLQIHTTISPYHQYLAHLAVADRLKGTEAPLDMALVSIDPRSGEVLAMIGGRDYAHSQVNLATGGTTGFQPGSSFKPFVLATAFTQGIGPDALRAAPQHWVVPGCTGRQCTISNSGGGDRGDIALRDAMASSVNTVFAMLINEVSISATIDLARSLGLERLDPNGPYGPSLALGAAETSTLEMASAYGVFANRGVRYEPIGVLAVLDRDGGVIWDQTNRPGTRVLEENVADNMNDVLTGVVTHGTGRSAAVPGHTVAGKTGTSQSYWAAWFVGYTPTLSTAVWMGHADGLAPLVNVNGVARVTGGSHPAVAFRAYMTAALADVEPVEFVAPSPILSPVVDLAPGETHPNGAVPYRPWREVTTAGAADPIHRIDDDCGGPCSLTELPVPDTSWFPPTTAADPSTIPPSGISPSSIPAGGPSTTTPSSPSTSSTTGLPGSSTTVSD